VEKYATFSEVDSMDLYQLFELHEAINYVEDCKEYGRRQQ
jgi:hypothetical protein